MKKYSKYILHKKLKTNLDSCWNLWDWNVEYDDYEEALEELKRLEKSNLKQIKEYIFKIVRIDYTVEEFDLDVT